MNSHLQRLLQLTGGHTAGNHRYVPLYTEADKLRLKPRRDNVRCACIDGRPALLQGPHRTGAQQEMRLCLPDGCNGRQARLGAQGNLRHRQTRLLQSLGQRHRLGRIVQHRNRNQAIALQFFHNIHLKSARLLRSML